MKTSRLVAVIFLSSQMIWIGCIPNLPESKDPALISKRYSYSFKQIWNSVFEVINFSEGTLVTEDQKSGMIVYSVSDRIIDTKSNSKVFMNVYIKEDTLKGETTVSLFPKVRQGYYIKAIDHDFYMKLDQIINRR